MCVEDSPTSEPLKYFWWHPLRGCWARCVDIIMKKTVHW